MKTLIVGCGYLGKRLGRRLRGEGGIVYGTARSAERAEALRPWGIEPVVADVTRPESLGTLPDVDRVVYCVAYDRSQGLPRSASAGDGLRAVIERVAGSAGVVLYTSTTGVYGQNDGSWVDEDSPAEPATESGHACLQAERAGLEAAKGRGIRFLALRLAGIYGPHRIIRRASLERGEPIAADPGHWINLIHVEDAARAIIEALDAEGFRGTYNVADGHPATRRELYEAAAKVLGAPAPTFAGPAPGSRDESNKRVGARRLAEALAFRPEYPDARSGLVASLAAEAEGLS